jgi:hypothetical protein
VNVTQINHRVIGCAVSCFLKECHVCVPFVCRGLGLDSVY